MRESREGVVGSGVLSEFAALVREEGFAADEAAAEGLPSVTSAPNETMASHSGRLALLALIALALRGPCAAQTPRPRPHIELIPAVPS